MNPPRAIQNFRGFRAVWWGPPAAAGETLASVLARLGIALTTLDEIGREALVPERDILFIDGDGAFDPATAARSGRILPRVPVIGVVGSEAPSRLKALSDSGATALLRKPIHPSTVYAALFLAVNNHARFARLEDRLEDADRRRSGRRFVVKALVRLMHERGLCDEQAFALLRRESMRLRMGLEDYAQTLCSDLDQPKEIDHATDQAEPAGDRGGPGRVGRGARHRLGG